ncbi:MAG TPA: TRAP transporter substrate-binding protein DctP [Hyphomicrobiaceae bacterium]|nr:TRAP transporter substrate-binding protein DctP [Hyphomicrobiaceae bacterium]
MTGLLLRAFVAGVALFAGIAQVSARELRLSHQWPESDARHKASRVLMAELRKRGLDLTISLHPNSSLKIKPVEQYDAMLEGKIELAVYPIAYQSAKIPEFSIGLLPGVPSSAETASLLKGSQFEEKLQRICEEKGFRILTWWWVGGGVASRSQEFAGPASVKGQRARGGDRAFDEMLAAAGASVSSMPSSEIRAAMEADKLDVALTSFESLMSFRVTEQAKFSTLGGQGIWVTFTPVIISKAVWDSLSDEERQALDDAARASNIYFEATQREALESAQEAFTKAGAKVRELTFDEYAAWLHIARDSSWKKYREVSPRAAELFSAMLQSFIDSGKR